MKSPALTTIILVGLALLVAAPQDGHAQERYAAFIHGIAFGDSRPDGVKANARCRLKSNVNNVYEVDEGNPNPFRQKACNDEWKSGGGRLKASGTPEAWKGGVIDNYIRLRYFDRDLYDDAGGIERDVTLDDTREEMMQRFVDHMKYKAPNADWVLFGHSQGGIVARLLHEYIRKNNVDLNVEGVLAVASPMQGAKPATVSFGPEPGYKNIQSTVNGFIEDVGVGPIKAGPASNFVAWVGQIFAHGELEDRINSMAVRKDAKEAIGPEGELIRQINSAPNPNAYRALLGAERAPVPFRILSGAETSKTPQRPFTGNDNSFLITDLDKKFDFLEAPLGKEDIPKFSAGEEPKTVEFYENLIMNYKGYEDKEYDGACTHILGRKIVCEFWDLAESKQWRRGRRALENIGRTHSKILDAYRMKRRRREVETCIPLEDATYDAPGRMFSPPTAKEHVNPRITMECSERVEYYVTIAPDKTDGLLGTSTTTWNPPTSDYGFEEQEKPNLGSHSILYNDRPSSNPYKRGGTGYNHAEMVYDKRRYSSSEDPGIGGSDDPSFSEGQRNPPMQNAESFLIEEVFE